MEVQSVKAAAEVVEGVISVGDDASYSKRPRHIC